MDFLGDLCVSVCWISPPRVDRRRRWEYGRQSDAFLRATEELVAAAKQRDLDLAAMHYVSMTMSCYQCHRYIKNMRIAN